MSERAVDTQKHHHRHMLPFGAQPLGNNETCFRFWAPSRNSVELVVDGLAPIAMSPTVEGWFEATAKCGPGARYRYRFDDGLEVPDPASRFQPDDVHGPSMVIDPSAYRWSNTDWRGRPWTETVLYEVHVGAMGGYRGVSARLPELAAIGVTAIELMPLSDFSGRHNWGYDGVLPFAPDSAYGTPDELKALIDAAHGFGLQVFVDVVYNHFGPDGNYLLSYAAPFFKEGTHTPWGPAIDFDHAETGQFFIENALYWIHEYRIDGLRFDAVHAIGNTQWLKDMAEHVRRSAEYDRHVHLVLENEANEASLMTRTRGHVCHFDAQWNDDVHNTLHVMLTGETESYYGAYAQAPARKLARALAEGFVYQGEPSPIHDDRPRGEPSAELPPTAFVFFLQNHDQIGNRAMGERLTLLAHHDALRAAIALMLLSPQIPLLFMGEEAGSTQPFLFFTDYEGDLANAVREGRRKEFAKFSAFSDPQRRADIPDPNDLATFQRSARDYLRDDVHVQSESGTDTDSGADSQTEADTDADRATMTPREWRHFYQSALAVRHKLLIPRLERTRSLGAQVLNEPPAPDGETAALMAARRAAPVSGAAVSSKTANGSGEYGARVSRGKGGGVRAQWQLGDGETLTIAVNLGDTELSLGDMPPGRIIFETPDRVRDHLDAHRLPAHAAVAWLTGDLHGFVRAHPEASA
ncbi:malto-oligosyltrehalose trehalohydrolase [Pararobbsia alpina]|uniref:malto-oligosyltrehalose trehalohydrolase n=1 Tax=Pararobbsia alpina TaxID=621374 RepID=UPI0039A757F8